MAAESDVDSFHGDRGLWWRRVQGRLFEGVLVTATVCGVLSLVALFGLIGWDALGPDAAAPTWYLVYFGTLVGPVAAHWLYVRRRPAAATINARSYAVVAGTLAISLGMFAIVEAADPYDVVIPTAAALLPPLAIGVHAHLFGESHLTGPAIPAALVVGLFTGLVFHGVLRPLVAGIPTWAVYFVLIAVPSAGLLGWLARRRFEASRAGLVTATGVVVVTLVAVFVALVRGFDPDFWVVMAAGVGAPVGLFTVDAVVNRPNGRVGLVGPVILVAGVLLGAWIEARYGIAGIDSWINPTLLLESWSDFRPEQAGIYPQLVGSIMIVSLMAIMSFPVGIGAAVYLEEYAPERGWGGRLATAVDVNISNLAGVPSVVYGLLGLALFRQVFGLSPGITIAAGATLGLLILPIVIVAAQEAIRAVPDEVRQASYGMGASRWQTVRNVVLPEAVPGILTGTILALGRAIGETAPLVMIGVATTRFSPPDGLFSGATALPLQIFAARGHNLPEYREGVVAAAALVLLVLMLTMNATAILVRNRLQER